MRMIWAVSGLLLLALVLAVAVAAQQDPSERSKEAIGARVIGDGVIVPGQRIGPLRLGMTIEQILSVMPPGYKRDIFSPQNLTLYEWRTEGVWVSLADDTEAIRVLSVFGTGNYRTDKSVQLMHPESKMVEVYGKDYRRYEYPADRITLIRYVPLGLQFGLVNQPGNRVLHGRIFQIGIFTVGKEPPLTKQPAK